ncbi:hypothetical protein CHO01_31610 [Cellulomonas hominis]|uniref:Uncharacterized protein n=1 Tax=Cellulomonas hominis TaxID=156981 RepID=A0A511FFM3_9CELL|nr:hypothetical protein CHO01_31610 [Cellulomonas hominis]
MSARAEAVLDLEPMVVDEVVPASDEPEDLTPEQLAVQALMAARHHTRTRGLRFTDPRDIAQSTMLTALEARAKNPDRVVTPAYVHQIASGHVAIALRGAMRVEDRKAKGIYDVKVRELEESLGRKTTGHERAAIARRIRDTWGDDQPDERKRATMKRHRPSERFVELSEMRVHSLDAPTGREGDGTLGDTISQSLRHAAVESEAIDPDSVAGAVLAQAEGQHYSVDSRGRASVVQSARKKAAAKDRLWEAFTEMSGVPEVEAGSMGPSTRRDAAAVMTAGGGVLAACRDWDNAEETPAVRALFAPFGRISPDEKDEVVELLRRHSAYADDLWESACRAAGRASAAA